MTERPDFAEAIMPTFVGLASPESALAPEEGGGQVNSDSGMSTTRARSHSPRLLAWPS